MENIISNSVRYLLKCLVLILPLVYSAAHCAPPDWSALPNLQYNMNVTSKLLLDDGTFSFSENDLVAGFVGDECRGVASPIEAFDGLIFLTIGSNVATGDLITFKAYLEDHDMIVDLEQTLVFQNLQLIGSIEEPFVFSWDSGPSTGFAIELSVILEGSHLSDQDFPMHTNLRDNNMVPLVQPFGPELPYYGNSSPVWYYTGSEQAASLPADVVDWLLLELRDAPAASQANAGTLVARQAVWLRSSGEVTGANGVLPQFDVPIEHDLFVVIYHRNHLAIMSSGPLSMVENVYSWDFTKAPDKAYAAPGRSSYQNGQKDLGNGVYGMYGGDGDANGQIQTQDKNEVWNTQSGSSGYLPGDFDMNGQVQTQDKNNIWNPNSGLASQVP